jgi:hypothetical protein
MRALSIVFMLAAATFTGVFCVAHNQGFLLPAVFCVVGGIFSEGVA